MASAFKCDHMKLMSTRVEERERLEKVDMGGGSKMPGFCGHLLWMAPRYLWSSINRSIMACKN